MHAALNKIRSIRVRSVSLWLVLAGVLICSYVIGSYAQMFWRQHQLVEEWQIHDPSVVNEDSGVARLQIPKIGLDMIVVEGTTKEALLRGPGHIEQSATAGSQGNVVIAAHRDTFFRDLNRLGKGDFIHIDSGHQTYEYVVTETKVVSPNDLSVLRNADTPRLTLITCYPFHYVGPAPKRFVIVSKLVTGNPGPGQELRPAAVVQ